MSRLLLFLLPAFLYVACQDPAKNASQNGPATDSVEKKNFFPVENVLKGEIADVDSTPSLIRLYHRQDGKKDSVQLKTKEFDEQAGAFLVPGLDSVSLSKRFTESSFMDQSTGMLTFTYSTKDTAYGLRRVDVLAEPSLTNDKVRNIYLEVSRRANDSLIIKKMTWSFGSYFNIVEIVHPPKGTDIVRETRVTWNNQ